MRICHRRKIILEQFTIKTNSLTVSVESTCFLFLVYGWRAKDKEYKPVFLTSSIPSSFLLGKISPVFAVLLTYHDILNTYTRGIAATFNREKRKIMPSSREEEEKNCGQKYNRRDVFVESSDSRVSLL